MNGSGAGGLGTGVDDFDGDHGADPDKGLLRGGTIRAASGGEAPIAAFGHLPPEEEHGAAWGAAWKKKALRWYDRSGQLMLEGEHFSYRQHYFDLDPAYTDKFGDPLLRLTLDWTDHERAQGALAARVQAEIGKAMGATVGDVVRGIGRRYAVTYYQSTHVQGGVIMGTSPDSSVVNPWLQHWQMPNLFVLGGSAFPQNASGNPTLTALALAYRAADGLVDRYFKRPGPLA